MPIRNPGKLSWACKDCSKKQPEAQRKQRSSRCVPCWNKWRNAKRKLRWDADKRAGLNASLVSRYGITIDDYETMHEEARGVCRICQGIEVELVVDHNHTTGTVRGLICRQCNLVLGFAKDNKDTLRAAALYLEETDAD